MIVDQTLRCRYPYRSGKHLGGWMGNSTPPPVLIKISNMVDFRLQGWAAWLAGVSNNTTSQFDYLWLFFDN